jgi:hypothetical protein
VTDTRFELTWLDCPGVVWVTWPRRELARLAKLPTHWNAPPFANLHDRMMQHRLACLRTGCAEARQPLKARVVARSRYSRGGRISVSDDQTGAARTEFLKEKVHTWMNKRGFTYRSKTPPAGSAVRPDFA